MIDIQARLDALPEWPQVRWQTEGYRLAALARLALWHELARDGDVRLVEHGPKCWGGSTAYRCTCGRDALLKKLEVPK